MAFAKLSALAVGAALVLATPLAAQQKPSADAQRQAILACLNASGIGGNAQLRTQWVQGQGTTVQIQPYDQVSAEAAAQINACAARSLGTAAPENVVAQNVVADHVHGGKITGVGVASSQMNLAIPTCPPNYVGMFRGTLFCVNGKVVR